MMGAIKALQMAMGYGPARGGRRCERCRHRTWAANALGTRLPYCQMGGFFVWLDYGCEKFGKAAAYER